MSITHRSMKNDNVKGSLELYGVEKYSGSIYPTEIEEWMHRVQKCFEIIGCDEDIKVTLVETMLIDDAKEWWFTLKEYLVEEAKQNWDVFQGMFGKEYFTKHYRKVRLREIKE